MENEGTAIANEQVKVYPGIRKSVLLIVLTFISTFAGIIIPSIAIGIYAGIKAGASGENAVLAKITGEQLVLSNMWWIMPFGMISGYGLITYLILRKKKISLREFFFEGRVIKDYRLILLAVFFIALSMFLAEILGIIMITFNMDLGGVKDLNTTLKGASGIVLGLIIAPIFEEIIFRGTILKGIAGKHGTVKGVLISAIMFSLYHMQPVQFIPAFTIGILFGIVYIKTGSVVMVIICHIIYNLFPIITTQFANTNEIPKIETIDYIILAVSMIVLSAAGFFIVKKGLGEKA